MSSVTLGADDDPRLKILIQEDKAKRPCSVSIKSVYWGQEWARSQPLERFRGQLTSVGRAGTLKRYKIKWVGGDEPEAGAGADLIKEEFDFQIEDGDEGEPAATLLPPRGTRRPRPAAEPEGSENGLSRETTSGSDNDESDSDDDSRPPPATAEAHGVVWTLKPEHVSVDARPGLRSNGKLISEHVFLNLAELFHHCTPPWWDDEAIKCITEQLPPGAARTDRSEMRKFAGYMMAIALHDGVPIASMSGRACWATRRPT